MEIVWKNGYFHPIRAKHVRLTPTVAAFITTAKYICLFNQLIIMKRLKKTKRIIAASDGTVLYDQNKALPLI